MREGEVAGNQIVEAGRGVLVFDLDGLETEFRFVKLRADEAGILRTATGHVLMGWPAAADGSVPSMPRDSMSGLQPIRIVTNEFVANPTTQVRLGVNLPATATISGAAGAALPLSVEYFGNLGTSESLGITFTPSVPASAGS